VTPIADEFKPSHPPVLSLAQNIGLLAGAMFWGFGCDIFGRKLAFNLTLAVTAVFGLVAASSPNFTAICFFSALWSFGVGGNLPVDSAVFLEFLPGSHQYLLTVLSIDWAIAQVVATLIAWPFLGSLTCQTDQDCSREANMGWRYFVLVMGGISLVEFIIRFMFFTVYESPKYLMGKGLDEQAVKIVHEVARRNGKTSTRKWQIALPDSAADTTNRYASSIQTQTREAGPLPRSSTIRKPKTGLFDRPHHDDMGIDRPWLPTIQ
jgi:MFS family permease